MFMRGYYDVSPSKILIHGGVNGKAHDTMSYRRVLSWS